MLDYRTMSTFCTTLMLEGTPLGSTKVSNNGLIEHNDSPKTDCRRSTRKKIPKYRSTMSDIVWMPYSTSVLPTFRFGFGDNSSFQLSVRTPSWLTGSVYSLLAQRSFQGWQLNLRAYEVVKDFDWEIKSHVMSDDPLALFQYLDERKMTLHVRDSYNSTLLLVSSSNSRKFLYHNG